MNAPSDANGQALADFLQQLLAGVQKPFTQGAGQIDANAVLKQLAADYVRDPARWQGLTQAWYEQHLSLWARMSTPQPAEANAPLRDRRFRASEWREPYFNWLSQSYLITAQWLGAVAEGADLASHDKRRAAFLMRQWIDAASPANYGWSNPEALKLAAETQGASIAQGLQNLCDDMPKGMVSMCDESAFEVGRNLAATPGAVVFENPLMQLIQYRPATATTYERPLLMVPPCINKFYVLDLQAETSLARYAVEQGFTVFMVSWRNVGADMGKTTWDDYVEHGLIAAIETARKICGVKKINALGFCVGGTLLANAVAVLRARRKNPVASLSLLATMLDYIDTGELSVFVDEAYVQNREREFANGGVLPGRELAITFASLRANELIWNYVVNNYLKGKAPPPFDLLYWNCDSTNLPGAMYVWYMRNTYLENNLCVPGRLKVCGKPLDLTRLDLPSYLLAAREDHIVPWKTAYASTQILQGQQTFVLGASGHVAGVLNPASRDKRNYWTDGTAGADPDTWLAGATSRPGSWWKHWSVWLVPHAGKRMTARATLGGAGYTEIEAAPGRYVHEKPDALHPAS